MRRNSFRPSGEFYSAPSFPHRSRIKNPTYAAGRTPALRYDKLFGTTARVRLDPAMPTHRLFRILLSLHFGIFIGTLALHCGVTSQATFADEGMFPISEISKLDLKAKGLELTADELFNTDADRTCVVDGICRVNGCTGSFVSPRGLIITNHHCAYRAIQAASSTENDYLKDGFIPAKAGQEIPATGYTVRVTESFREVSEQVLEAVADSMSFSQRSKAIEQRIKELETQAESDQPGKRAEIAEMFAGKTYVLFIYTYIKDVRLVFAPPSSIGKFGGDVDNWQWPRHTGDFSFMRAYVAPDGSSASYSSDNVPYQPKKFIQVSAAGANEGDFVMLLGYPGRTARHKTASYLEFEQQVHLPHIVDYYGQQIETMAAASAQDRSVAIKLGSRIARLANTEKRSRGQLKGLAGAGIVAKRRAEETKLQAFIDADPSLKNRYGQTLAKLDAAYAEATKTANSEANFHSLRLASQMMAFAFTIYDGAVERQKPDLQREAAYMDRNYDQTLRLLRARHKDLELVTDQQLLGQLLDRMDTDHRSKLGLPTADQLDGMYQTCQLKDAAKLDAYLAMSADELKSVEDPFIQLTVNLYPEYLRLRELGKERAGQFDQLYGDLVTAKQQFQKSMFVPDANATLRLTHGTVRGYSPADAIWMKPTTTLAGVIAKTTGKDPFETPAEVIELHKQREFGKYAHPKLNDVPVAILYDTDTTGGNSGSPILNTKGQLVGVNFDRAFEATINDFAWNTNYSRSIGVDIRYALWITDTVYKAKFLIEEMGL